MKAKKRGFVTTGADIVKRESFLALYKGLGAVLTGIVPKMAIRFSSYEWYKGLLADKAGNVSGQATFLGESARSSAKYRRGRQYGKEKLTTYRDSWSIGWCNRSSGGGHANGGCED